MQIQEIELKNFRPYYGTTTISPQTEKEKPLILIQGKNDTGKTSLFTAIRFCLYGASSREERDKHINRRAATEAAGTTKVSITFEHQGELFIVERGIEYAQANSARDRRSTDWYREVRKPDEIVVERSSSEPEYRRFINRFIPENIAQFFFFDAEQLEEFEEDHDETVRESIETVLGIQEIENAIDDLEGRKTTFERELSETESTIDKVNKLRSELGELLDELDEIGDEKEGRIKQKYEKIETKRKSLEDIQDALNKAEGADELRENIADLDTKINNKQNELNEDLLPERDEIRREIGPFIIATGSDTFLNTFEIQGVKGETGVIQSLLDRDTCICGEDLTEEKRQRLLDRFNRLHGREQRLLGELKQIADDIQIDVETKLHHYQRIQSSIRESRQEIVDLKTERDELQDKLDSIEQEYSEELKEKKSRLNNEIKQLESDVEELKNRRAVLESDKKDLNRRIASLEGASEEKSRFSSLINLTERCTRAFEEIKQELVESRRKAVEQKASETFNKLTNRPEYYERLEITPNYELRVVTEDATRSIEEQDPSAGARQIIAYSFIAGLSAFTTRNAPVVIDTPIGRLDPEHKNNLIRHYHEFSDQVVVLYQPNELQTEDIELMEKYIAKHYRIVIQDDEVSSTIEELSHVMALPSEN